MKRSSTAFLISDLRAPFDAPEGEIIRIAKTKMKRVCSSAAGLHFRLYKKSFDARKRNAILQVCTVLVTSSEPLSVADEALHRVGIRPFHEEKPVVLRGTEPLDAPPLVVGMGPAGLFAALLLAEEGYRPVIIDRGDDVWTRAVAAERFRLEGVLDTESNIQFGAGGAGTFSDGKLVTRVNDPLCNYVLSRLVEFGAPEEVLVRAKPHVGTDILRRVVSAVLCRIEALGGSVLYRTRMTGLDECERGVTVRTDRGDIAAGAVLLAVGHSARDTFSMLMEKGLLMEPKPFSVGVRIEHLRADIDRALYGDAAGHPLLGAAEYALSDTTGARGVYTFCMCPGGEVVAAASEEGGVVVNGMSYHAREGVNSNSALLVTITPEDVGGSIEASIAFQRRLEKAAFGAGGVDYCAPVMTVGDLLSGKRGSEPSRVLPTYGGGRVRVADLREVLPDFVTDTLVSGLRAFDRRLGGFAASDAVLTAVESRTSSPLRMLRGESRTATGHDRLYPAGEGAGYAGGITSAALDGLRSALALIGRFEKPRSTKEQT
ncbi:MAG: hypothetical protein E7663_01720 [Ruminococcaceae bacterium]|nr:hypothetical protein [Oscillospiraceae bacterium]